MKKRVFSGVVVMLLLCAAAFAQKINTDYDHSANFSNYHTFMWEKSPKPARGFWNQRIIDAVNKELQAKGLTEVQSNPDVWVVYSNSIHDQKEVIGSGYGFGPAWGWGYWGPGNVTYNTYVTKKGTLVVEIADAKDHELLWRGSAMDTISDNSNKNLNNLNKAVQKMFSYYPPKDQQKK
jgi:hypothetical protein